MHKFYLTTLAAVMLLMFAFRPVKKQPFVMNNIPVAQEQAAHENKLLLVQFTARWCTPCQMMEQNTWTNPDLIDFMSENCVAAKVDIENFDGMTYTKDHNVKSVPTLLVFSADGRLLGRYENSISASHLIKYLESFISPDNTTAVATIPDMASSASTTHDSASVRSLTAVLEQYGKEKAQSDPSFWINGEREVLAYQQQETANFVGPTRPLHDQAFEPTPQITASDEEMESLFIGPQKANTPFVSHVIAPQTTEPSAATAPLANVTTSQNLVYTVQIGAFRSRKGADTTSKNMIAKLKTQTWVINPEETHDQLYRVVSGAFHSRTQANAFVISMKNNGFTGFVRTLPEAQILSAAF
jgi:thioredoxin-related protein/cell division septation protein DedD